MDGREPELRYLGASQERENQDKGVEVAQGNRVEILERLAVEKWPGSAVVKDLAARPSKLWEHSLERQQTPLVLVEFQAR